MSDYRDSEGKTLAERMAERCGPTHHHACACREAAVAKLVEQVEEAEEAMNVLGRHDKDKLTIASYKLRRALAEFHGRKA